MSLINCPECGEEISDTVKSCPHCGYKTKKRKTPNKKLLISLAAVGCLIIGIIIISHITAGSKRPDHISPETYEDGLQALDIVDDFLDGYSDAKTARNKLDKIYERIKARCEINDITSDYYKDGNVQSSVFIISQKLLHLDLSFLSSPVTVQDAKEAANGLRKLLNVK